LHQPATLSTKGRIGSSLDFPFEFREGELGPMTQSGAACAQGLGRQGGAEAAPILFTKKLTGKRRHCFVPV
jgi:hypothetical protein